MNREKLHRANELDKMIDNLKLEIAALRTYLNRKESFVPINLTIGFSFTDTKVNVTDGDDLDLNDLLLEVLAERQNKLSMLEKEFE